MPRKPMQQRTEWTIVITIATKHNNATIVYKTARPAEQDDASAAKPEITIQAIVILTVMMANTTLPIYAHFDGLLFILIPNMPVVMSNNPHQSPCNASQNAGFARLPEET